ncbi:ferrochelatase [Nitrospirillum sp. BR 11752]|uniref:ferrochelatase n=1 Tax=Nitrospirillum sp. BR 11752 TaxID=3104293 RepID=UPI003FA54E89
MSPLPLPETASDAAPKTARGRRIAVVLFNLGGPDRLEAVRPFLYNLFRDPAIIRLPAPLRQMVAHLISSRRDKVAQEIYRTLGGGSPLCPTPKRRPVRWNSSCGTSEPSGPSSACAIGIPSATPWPMT